MNFVDYLDVKNENVLEPMYCCGFWRVEVDFRESKVREERKTRIWEALGCGNWEGSLGKI